MVEALVAAGRRYALVAPSRDEAATMRRTLDSLLAQTVCPTHLIFVDDGSTDSTQAILSEYLKIMPYLKVVTRHDRGVRSVGPGVIEAFNAGLAEVSLDEIDFLCKLDMDVELPPRYFELLMDRMEADPELATCSGKPFFLDEHTGALVSENIGDQFSVGMTKFYRVSAWKVIGGFPTSIGWDGIDCHLCRMDGMRATSFPDIDLNFIHLRPMGSSHINMWHGRMRHGLGAWVMGTPPLFMLVASLYRMSKRPHVVGGVAMFWGYVKAWHSGVERFDAPGYLAFVRTYQLRALIVGRRRAAEHMRQKQRRSRRAATVEIVGRCDHVGA